MADEANKSLKPKRGKPASSLNNMLKNLAKPKCACKRCGMEFLGSSGPVPEKFCSEKCRARPGPPPAPADSSPPSSAASSPRDPDNPFSAKYKTQLCVHFESRGSCSYGVRCAFAHGKFELQRKAHPPKEKDNAPGAGKTPKVQQKAGRSGGSRDGSSKGDRHSKSDLRSSNSSITSSNGGVGGSSSNISRSKASRDGRGQALVTGSSPRHATAPAPLRAAAAAAPPAASVGSLGGGWDDSAGDLGGGWDAATLLDEAAKPPPAPAPQAKAAAPAHRAPPQEPYPPHRNGGGGGSSSFFDITNARGGRAASGVPVEAAREEPLAAAAPATGFGDWLLKTPPGTRRHPVEAAANPAYLVPHHPSAHSPMAVAPPPSRGYAGGLGGRGGRASEGREAVGPSGDGDAVAGGDLGAILSRMGLGGGRFALGQDAGGEVDVEAFALGAMGGHGLGGLHSGL